MVLRMMSNKNLFFFGFFIVHLFTSVDATETVHPSVGIGVVLDLKSSMGQMLNSCLSMAVSDFYSVHAKYKTRLSLHVKNAKEELQVGSAVVELLKNETVLGVMGPEWLTEAAIVAEQGSRAQVPVVSFTAKTRAFSSSQSDNFVQMALDDVNQVKGLAAICQNFKWNEIVVLYEDTEYGNLFLSKVIKVFQEADIRLRYISALSTSCDDVFIAEELLKSKKFHSRVFLVHMNNALVNRLFSLARDAGMMSEGHAWLVTDIFSNPVDSNLMEGVLGIRPYFPKSKRLESFKARWKKISISTQPESTTMEMNMYGLWGYDTVWAMALAVEKSLQNTSDFSNLRASKVGLRILSELLKTNFNGLTGKFQLLDGKLQPSAFEIFYLVGTGDRTVGYWIPGRGIFKDLNSNSLKVLKAILWPGETLVAPKAFPAPTTGKLKVGVPKKEGFKEFVNVEIDPLTNQLINVSGFSIDLFLATLDLLPFKPEYEFMSFSIVTGLQNGSYTDMLKKIPDKTYDMVVGDITILADRAAYVDFTLPYTESGVVMVVRNRKDTDMWSFLKPLSWDLWLTIVAACVFVGVVLRIMERERNSPEQQNKAGVFFFPVAALAFPERDMVANKWSKFVLIVWLFMAYVLMQSYTAKLSSIFTVDQLDFVFSKDYYVGHQLGSYVKDFLINDLELNQLKLKSFKTFEEFHDAMKQGGRKGGIDAFAGEIPYMKLFLSRYGSEYRIAGQPYRTSGFGFAFPCGSPLVSHFSKAILNITQSPMMTAIEKKNFGPGYPDGSINRDDSRLTASHFGGLFIIIYSATMAALCFSQIPDGLRLAITVPSNFLRCSETSRTVVPGGSSSDEDDASVSSAFEEANGNISSTLDLPNEVHGSNIVVADVSEGQSVRSC